MRVSKVLKFILFSSILFFHLFSFSITDINEIYSDKDKKNTNEEEYIPVDYQIIKEDDGYILQTDNEYGPYEYISEFEYLEFADSWYFFTKDYEGYYLILNESVYGPYNYIHQPHYNLINMTWFVFIAKKTNDYYAIIDGEEFGPYLFVSTPASNLVSKTWGFTALKDDGWYVVINGEEYGPYDEVCRPDISYSGTSWAYRITRDDGYYIIINGNEFGPFISLEHFSGGFENPFYMPRLVIFSEDSEKWALIGQKQDGYYLVRESEIKGPFLEIDRSPGSSGTGYLLEEYYFEENKGNLFIKLLR